MSETFVTVATFHRTAEAQLAKNLLEEEGIASTLSGELTADMLPFGQAGGGDQIVLQVPESGAQRAAGILAAVAAAKLDDNWEDEAESGSDVWMCSICGEPISNRLPMCYSCQTPREGIRTSTARDNTAIQQNLITQPRAEAVQNQLDFASNSVPEVVEETRENEPVATAGDDLARRALFASMSGILLPFSWYYLAKLFSGTDELSQKGTRHLYGALILNGWYILFTMILCGGAFFWR
jgi:hypothetical protein